MLDGAAPSNAGSRPVLLDLFCGAGGAAKGYHDAGFGIIGIDITDQPNYPYTFIRADALTIRTGNIPAVAAIHASPPCQHYSPLAAYHGDRDRYPDLIAPVRELLADSGVPWVIENVPQAPLINPIELCGAVFDIPVYRHRRFESSGWLPPAPPHRPHQHLCTRNGYLPTPTKPFMSIHGGKHSRAWQQAAAHAMNVPWMTTITEVCESIPPAYTRWVGQHLLTHLADTPTANAA